MIKAIEMNREDMEEILKHMPKHLKEKIEDMIKDIKPDSGIERVREFCQEYEDDDIRDHIIAHTLSTLIKKIGSISTSCMKEWRKKGKKFNTYDMGMVVIECLKDEAKHIQNALDSHEKECTKGDDCGAKH